MAEILVYEKLIKPTENERQHLYQLFTQKERITQNELCPVLHSNEFFIKMYTIMKTKQGLFKEKCQQLNFCFVLFLKERLKLVNWLYI